MEKFLDFIMYALLGHDYQVRYNGRSHVGWHSWMLTFEGNVRIILDEKDIQVIQFIADNFVEDQESKDRYNHLLEQLTIDE